MIIPPPTDRSFALAIRLRRAPTPSENRLRELLPHEWGFAMSSCFGPFVADFLSVKHAVCVEVDGSSHRGREDHDARRDAFFASHGCSVVRVTVRQVNQRPQLVLDRIADAIGKQAPRVPKTSKKQRKRARARQVRTYQKPPAVPRIPAAFASADVVRELRQQANGKPVARPPKASTVDARTLPIPPRTTRRGFHESDRDPTKYADIRRPGGTYRRWQPPGSD